jgi:hypothetical protein
MPPGVCTPGDESKGRRGQAQDRLFVGGRSGRRERTLQRLDARADGG